MTHTRLYAVAALACGLLLLAFDGGTPSLKHEAWRSIKVTEPSDLCLAPGGQSLYIVSDDAFLYEIDFDGKILRRSDLRGIDFEGVWADAEHLWVVDETPRHIHQLEHKGLSRQRSFTLPYAGGRNKGFESIAFNAAKGRFVMATERDPIMLYEVDADFRPIDQVRWTAARDISAITWHEGHPWLLSDEDRTIFKCDPQDYRVLAQWRIDVLNPEGLAFLPDGRLIVAADDLQRLYYFKHPEQ